MGYITAIVGTYIVTRWVGPWAASAKRSYPGKAAVRRLFGSGGPGEERNQQ